MIQTQNVTLQYGSKKLFENVSLKFNPGNCYGLIGANGTGKSTFIKILSGENNEYTGDISVSSGARLAVLKQDHYAYDEYEVLETVIAGNKKLLDIKHEKDAIYEKPDFNDEDGIRAGELESMFEELGGYEAESEAAVLLDGLGVESEKHSKKMKDLQEAEKVKVLLAQSLFGNPDVLLLDEPTNGLDIKAIMWLENFLLNFKNTVIVVSHDRHFLNKVCTHIADIDFGKIQLFVGNYDFWFHSSQLALKLIKDKNKRNEEKAQELKDFIARFSANASKSKQATSRKRELEKLTFEDIKPSSRKYPYVDIKSDREAGNDVLEVEKLSKTVNGELLLNNVSFQVNKGDKIAVLADDERRVTALYEILSENEKADSGKIKWGVTITKSYLPADNTKFFESVNLDLVDWLRQYSKDQDEKFIRGFLGRMLFAGEDALKKVNVLSGGERVRMMLSKLMLSGANFLIVNNPTHHLDLESISSVNDGLINFKGTLLFSSHDHEFLQTVANKIISLDENGLQLFDMTYDEYLDQVFNNS
ncbi:MAG: ATP-binding cassette domain-containing protein [Spirochaetia bacterium]|nr:ATP-binding cassette domain-containing protein [Spirochaetia bacterium]